MKTPSNYGSENEETSFLRRIAAPDRGNANRKNKKRMAVVGATVGLLAATSVVGYATLRNGSMSSQASLATQQLEANSKAVAARSQFVTPLDDSFYPSLEQLDLNGNKVVEQSEYLKYLQSKKDADENEVNESELPQAIKDNICQQIEDNFDSDANCVVKAMKRIKANKITLSEKNLPTLYYSLDEFCPTNGIEVPDDLINEYAEPYVPPTEAPVVPDTYAPDTYAPDTSAPDTYAPDTSAPDTYAPETSAPDTFAPDTYAPETSAPDTSAPDTYAPDTTAPDTSAPDTYAPDTYALTYEPVYEVTDAPIYEPTAAPGDDSDGPPEEYEPVTDAPAIYEEPTAAPGDDSDGPPEEYQGPAEIEEPVTTNPYEDEPVEEPVISPYGGGGAYEPSTDAPEGDFMTKDQFRQQLLTHFSDKNVDLVDVAAKATEEASVVLAKIKALDDCIDQASNKFGWYGVYEQEPHFSNACDWVSNVCLPQK